MMPFYDIPYVPSSDDRLDTMIKLAEISPPCLAIDLGCGDGRVVRALARAGALAHGVEVDPVRCNLACKNLIRARLLGKAFISNSSIWETSLFPFDVVTVYGITGMMGQLEHKLRSELKPGARFVSNGFLLPNWSPAVSQDSVHLYIA